MTNNPPGKVSETLLKTALAIPAEGMTVGQLVTILGEQGRWMFCITLAIPFVLPIQVPGSSTFLGPLIALIALGIVLNRIPHFPHWLTARRIASTHLGVVLEQGAHLFARVEGYTRPRWLTLSRGEMVNRVTGLVLLLAAGLLALPLIIPFSNILPALAILLLAVGILQHDGLFILGGYVATLGTAVYFVAATLVAVHGLHMVAGII